MSQGQAPANKSHGHAFPRTPEYGAWEAMKTRCYNERTHYYRNYGGRGIRVCTEWLHDFAAFLDHVGPRPTSEHSIDRIDVNGHYEPGNVRWATRSEQARNRQRKARSYEPKGQATGLRNGTHTHPERRARGRRNPLAVLSDTIVTEARQRARAGEPRGKIASSLGVERSVLGLAIIGKTWTHVTEPTVPSQRRSPGKP